jgi:hypothetical protein
MLEVRVGTLGVGWWEEATYVVTIQDDLPDAKGAIRTKLFRGSLGLPERRSAGIWEYTRTRFSSFTEVDSFHQRSICLTSYLH